MHQKKIFSIIASICFIFFSFNNAVFGQVVSHQVSLMDYLGRMAQKGNIEFNDFIKPIDRKIIFQKLIELNEKKELSEIEKKELDFFLTGFLLENPQWKQETIQWASAKQFISTPLVQQNVLAYKDKDFGFMVNPVGNFTVETHNNKFNTIQGKGLQLIGYAGKFIGFQMSFLDLMEQGRFDSSRIENELPGFVRKTSTNPSLLNYSQMNATISLKLNKAIISIGQDQHVMGYGANGNILLSDKSPAYPFYALQYQPSKWLRFNYMHAWLQSGVLDTRSSYNLGNSVYGGIRQKYLPKYFATHSVEITPIKGLNINLGESMVYSDQLELAYMLPITFFKAFDNQKYADNILTGSNGQFFFGFSSRNQLSNTHIYGQWMIDEIRLGTIFNSGTSRNQLGYQLGFSVTDLFKHYLTLRAEYTRLNPFMYRNFIAAQNYTNANFTLGDWMGSNSDRFYLSASLHPMANLNLKAFAYTMRKNGEPSIEIQYFAQPQPKFGFDPLYKRTRMGLEAQWEVWNNLFLNFGYAKSYQKANNGDTKWLTDASFGICWNKF